MKKKKIIDKIMDAIVVVIAVIIGIYCLIGCIIACLNPPKFLEIYYNMPVEEKIRHEQMIFP